MQTSQPQPPQPKKRGRPVGRKDAAPRKRRSSEVVKAEKIRKVREGDMQAQCMAWLSNVPAPGIEGAKLGDYSLAVPNGIWLPGADLQQRIRVIMTMRRQGMKKGYPDMSIDLPLHGRPGARFELKRYRVSKSWSKETSKMGDEQIVWCERLRSAGYFVEVVVGVAGFCAAVGRYIRGENPLPFPWEEASDAYYS
jgi:hypothetical protein